MGVVKNKRSADIKEVIVMTIGFILRTIAEVAVVAFLIWGFLHEDKFIRFEDRLARIVAVNIRRIRHRRMLKKQGAVPAARLQKPMQTQTQKTAAPSVASQQTSASTKPISRPARRRRKKVSQSAA
ncbi:MAG: hypothetical protein MR815_01965 [Oscillospiraceae bacterium]|nr:hypothetical protein [Oscillospiraceae bacterium]